VREKEALIDYIKKQENHHKKIPFVDEMRQLLTDAKIDYDEKYLN
jgi:hypothetical protein